MRGVRILLCAALLATACSDGDPSPSAEPDPEALADELASNVPQEPTTTTTLRPPVPTDPPPLPEAMIGELVIPCMPADAGELPERPGVTDEAIVIGTGSDRGGLATSDAGNGIVEMIEVVVDLCNASGGLLGREVQVIEYDAAAVEAADRVAEACTEVAALVGHRFLQEADDVLGALECGLSRVPADAAFGTSGPVRLHAQLAAAFSDPTGAAVAIVGPDTPTDAARRDRYAAAIALHDGPLDVVASLGYPIDRLPDWDRIVGDARAAGAGQVFVSGGCRHAILPFAEVAAAAGWSPVYSATASAYDDACLEIAEPERLFIALPFLPVEDGDDAPALAAHLALLERVGSTLTGDGVMAASAFWRWVSGATECLATDPDPTCGVALDRWTAGGLHAAVSADGAGDGCAVVVGLGATGFERRLPVDPGTYECGATLSVSPPP
ncbi:MAG: hypothetical protein AAF548_14300 [Actinomycetota bacterium]